MSDPVTNYQCGNRLPRESIAVLRHSIRTHGQHVNQRVLRDGDALGEVETTLANARGELCDCGLRLDGWSVLLWGLSRVYKGGYRAFRVAEADPTAENLHELRKQAKYLRHQLQLLGNHLQLKAAKLLSRQAHRLTRLLGDDHDLVVLMQCVTANPSWQGGNGASTSLIPAIESRRLVLQQRAIELGRLVYRLKPKAFSRRVERRLKSRR